MSFLWRMIFLIILFFELVVHAESGSVSYQASRSLTNALFERPINTSSVGAERAKYCQQLFSRNCTFNSRTDKIWKQTYQIVGQQCIQEQKQKGCDKLLQEQPDVKGQMLDCSPVGICMQQDNLLKTAEAMKGCFWNAPQAFDEDIGQLVVSLPSAIINQYQQCYGNPKDWKTLALHALICQNTMYYQMKLGNYIGNNYDKIYRAGQKWVLDKGVKLQCFSPRAQSQLICYGILSVIAPIKVPMLKNTPKWLKNIFEKTEKPRPEFGRKIAPVEPPKPHPFREELRRTGRLPTVKSATGLSLAAAGSRELGSDVKPADGGSMAKSRLLVPGKETVTALKQRLLHFDPTTDIERLDMIQFVNTSSQRGAKVIDIENTVMKDLNGVLDQDVVTSLTNHHKLLIDKKFETLFEKYKGQLDFKQYSDFKSQRFALIPKNAAWKATGIPQNVIKEFENAFKEANAELATKVKSMGLDQEIVRKAKASGISTDLDSKKWFRAGIDSNADEANWNSRLSRELPSQDGFATSDQSEIVRAKSSTFNQINIAHQSVVNELGSGSPLLQSNSGVLSLKSDVFDLLKKAKYNPEEIKKSLQFYYPGSNVSDKAIEDLIQTAQLTDRVQPSIWQTTRTVSSVGEAKHGALLIDVTGMGANNAEQALLQSVKCSSASQLSICARIGEREVTRAFQDKMAKIRDVTIKHCREVKIYCSITISGDDVRIIPQNGPLPQGFARENLNRINQSIGSAQIRQAQILPNVPAAARVAIGQDGEAIEKYLREKLRRSGLAERSKQMTFNISMRTTQESIGPVRIEMSGAGANSLTAAERSEMIAIQRETIRQFNAARSGRNYQFVP